MSGFVYDDAGNMTVQPTGLNSRRLFVSDAWNRLVRVDVQDRDSVSDPWNTARTRSVYSYYAMHQRATAIADADLDLDAEADRAEHYYYDAGWRLLERRRDSFTNAAFGSEPSFVLDKVDQFIWGRRYIDELMYHRTSNGAGLYALTDRNFSVLAMSDNASTLRHRTRYTAYGEARTTRLADINADGVVDANDQGLLLGAFGKELGDTGYPVEADLNHDGIIDSDDFSILLNTFGQSVPVGDVSTTDPPVGYAGYIFDDATGLYCVRFRWYAPEIGRWLSRDPLVFRDGSNLYQYGLSSSVVFLDPDGRKACCGPAVDSWFVGEINRHSKFFSNNAPGIGPLRRPFFFKPYAKDIPYKWMDFGSDCSDDQGQGCTGTVRLCGTCIHKSELGNIIFGAIGKQFLRSGGLVLGGGRRGGRPEGIDSPEDLASVLSGIMMAAHGDLGSMDSASMCNLLQGNYTSEHREARTVFNEEYRKIFDQVDPADLMVTMGAKTVQCGECGARVFNGSHSDFSTLDGKKPGNGIPWRDVYKNMPISWPGDSQKDPCCK